MKRYMLFAGDSYYAKGGMQDFIGTYDTLAEALLKSEGCWEYCSVQEKEFWYEWDWYHVYDSHYGVIVSGTRYQAHGADDKWEDCVVKMEAQ